ncbi:MAG: hypothetical protein QJR00_02600 [Bacillota bacterium]|nr:hypothetical protein [Bacillota bacterium]
MVYAWVQAAVVGLFTLNVVPKAIRSPWPPMRWWAAAIAMGFLATLAYLGAVYWENAWLFRLYYLLGAMWMAAYMGLGSLHLEWGQRHPSRLKATVVGVLVLSLLGAILLALLPVQEGALLQLAGQPGTGAVSHQGVLGALWLIDMILLNTFGLLAVMLVAAASAWRAYTARAPRRVAVGNGLIALGVLLLGAAGTAARVGFPGSFWVVMAVGWVVVYSGFGFIGSRSAGQRRS